MLSQNNYIAITEAVKLLKQKGINATSNKLQYLINYGRISSTKKENKTLVSINDLYDYYASYSNNVVERYKKKFGNDIDWNLSFMGVSQSQRTKHIHGIHPYKGKYIPQLVEYFLDSHIDEYKKEVYFKPDDIVLDPFAGSGTTLIVANELGINSIGMDISEFNCMIMNAKLADYNLLMLKPVLYKYLNDLIKFSEDNFSSQQFQDLYESINEYNLKYFKSPEYRRSIVSKLIDEKEYSKKIMNEFIIENKNLVDNFENYRQSNLNGNTFRSIWLSNRINREIDYYLKLIQNEKDENIKNLMEIILSRAVRSCRSTTHSDLATLISPVNEPYYCIKHHRICVPIDTITGKMKTYTADTIKRIIEFSYLKKDVKSLIINGNSENIDLFKEYGNVKFGNQYLRDRKIDGIFTSPPYVGQLDYYEQHEYAYDIFDIPKFSDDEQIGIKKLGKGIKAREKYVNQISNVFWNISRYLNDNANIFIVANDQFDLYPEIAKKSNMEIIKVFKRPVLDRTEVDNQPYIESIFHLKKIN